MRKESEGRTGSRRGIWTVDDLEARCVVDPITGCWEWAGARRQKGTGSAYIAALGRQGTLGVLACVLKTKKPPKPGAIWHCTCDTKDCANPDHRKEGNKSTAQRNRQKSPQCVANLRIARRKYNKITDEQAAEIRQSDAPSIELAEKYGISRGYVCSVRVGSRRRAQITPNASVFNWQPSAQG